MVDNQVDQSNVLVARSKGALYKFRGFHKVHITDLFFPIYLLVPELLGNVTGEDQFATFLAESANDLGALLPINVKYVWIQKNDIIPKKTDYYGIDVTQGNMPNHEGTVIKIWANKSKVANDSVDVDFEGLEEELARSKAFYEESYKQTRTILDSVRQHGILPVQEVANVVDDITASVARNPNALLCMRGLQSADEYTYFHCINVSLLATIFAQYLGYNDDEVWEIGLAGILHDIGKQRIPLRVLNATRKLTEEEFAIMKLHPQAAYEILKDVQGLGEGVMKAITCHHEKYDGSGYPYGLKGDEIHPYAAILSLADVYDALTSVRPYKEAFTQNKTASIIYNQKGTSFGPELIEKFVCCFGVYPIGSLVRLNSGEFGIVYENNDDDLLHPKILKLTRIYDTFLINRAKPIDLRTVKNDIRIVACEDCKDYNIELNQILSTFTDKMTQQ